MLHQRMHIRQTSAPTKEHLLLCDQPSRKTVQEAIDARDLRPHPMDDNLRKAKPRELNDSAPTDPQTSTLPPPSSSTFSVLGKLAVLLQARTTQTVVK